MARLRYRGWRFATYPTGWSGVFRGRERRRQEAPGVAFFRWRLAGFDGGAGRARAVAPVGAADAGFLLRAPSPMLLAIADRLAL